VADAPVVTLVGWKALMADAAHLDDDNRSLVKALQKAARDAVAPIAAAVRSQLPHVSGDLAGTVRTSAYRSGAAVRVGTTKVVYGGWVDFGGTRPQGPTDRAARPFYKDGRYLFPAAKNLQADVLARFEVAVPAALEAFGWTNETDDGAQVHD
jgi:hypothetical protein